tara:strand:+ start:1566 stop:1763 length:198 start_codon:yes stop_codon:yes gene_type:complete
VPWNKKVGLHSSGFDTTMSEKSRAMSGIESSKNPKGAALIVPKINYENYNVDEIIKKHLDMKILY